MNGLTRLQTKRTRRNALSKRKRWLRNRGMSPSWKPTRRTWNEIYREVAAANALPLRGVRADLRSTIPKSTVAKKQGFFARLFRRVNA
jgi:hypothetical protein